MDHTSSAPITQLTQAQLNSALITEAKNGQHEQVSALIAQGADLNATNPLGNTALMRAAIFGHAAVVTALLSSPDFDTTTLNATNRFGGSTALMFAARSGQAAVVRALLSSAHFNATTLNAVNHSGDTALMIAALNGHTTIVTALLSTPHFNATTLNATERYGGRTALMFAAENGHNEVAFSLLNSMSSQAIVATRPNLSFIERVFFREPVITPIEASYNQALTTLRQGLRNMVGAFNEQDSRPNLGRANALMNIIAGYYAPDWCLNPNREMRLVLREITNPFIFSRTSNVNNYLRFAFNRLTNTPEPPAEQSPSKNPRP